MTEAGAPQPRALRTLGVALAITLAYAGAGRLAVLLALPTGFAAPIWPSAGIAVVGLLLGGLRLWPAVVIGSVLVNIDKTLARSDPGSALLISTAIGAGAALQAALGAHLIRRTVGYPTGLLDFRQVGLALGASGPLCCLISTTTANLVLWGAGLLPIVDLPLALATWYVGDTAGVLLGVPVVLAFVGAPTDVWRERRISVALPLIVMLGLSAAVAAYIRHADEQALRAQLDQYVDRLQFETGQRVGGALETLHAIERFYAGSSNVDRDEFRVFVRRPLERHPSIHALEWVPHVPHAQRDALREQAIRDGLTGFQFRERSASGELVSAAERPHYYPVYYVEPQQGNEAALGFDLASEPTRLAALTTARDSGQLTLTAPIRLVQATGQRAGFLAALPIFSGSPRTIAERQDALEGFALGVFLVEQMLPTVALPDGLSFQLVDADAPADQGRLSGAPTPAARTVERTLDIGGRRWILQLDVTQAYIRAHLGWRGPAVLSGLLVLTAMLGLLLLLVSGRKAAVEQLIAERTMALVEARDRAKAANQAKTDFIANISHEVRTPMTAILGYGRLLLAADSIAMPQETRERSLHGIVRNGEHLLAIINDILDISRMEADKIDVEIKPCSLSDLLGQLQSMMRARAIEKELHFGLELTSPVPERIATDRIRLRQILINLVGNAIKFTHRGSVYVRVSADADARQVRIAVADSGIGIPAGALPTLFEPFTQADASTTRRFGGTGLGLAISQRLARHLGGRIDVESAIDQGSTFTLTLDLTPVEGAAWIETLSIVQQAPIGTPARIGSTDLADLRILVADDIADNRELIRRVLERAGATVISASDGAEACRLVRAAEQTEPIDLVLMDIEMPVLDGLEATRRLKRMRPELPVIALTAHAMSDHRNRCLDAGCDDYLSKPFSAPELVALLERFGHPDGAP